MSRCYFAISQHREFDTSGLSKGYRAMWLGRKAVSDRAEPEAGAACLIRFYQGGVEKGTEDQGGVRHVALIWEHHVGQACYVEGV